MTQTTHKNIDTRRRILTSSSRSSGESEDIAALTSPTWVPDAPLRVRVGPMLQFEQRRIDALGSAVLPKHFPVKQIAENSINIHSLNIANRKLLLEGPKTSITADGNITIRNSIPTRALIVSCTEVHDLFHVKPLVTRFRVHGKVDINCIEVLLDTFTTEKGIETNAIKLTSSNFKENILMYQACLALGIMYDHTKPLLNALRAKVTSRLLSTEELNFILIRVPTTDPLLNHLANDLCHRRFKKIVPDIASFEKWLGKKSVLQNAMMKIDQTYKKRRVVINRQKCSWRLDSELKKWGDNRKEDLEEAKEECVGISSTN